MISKRRKMVKKKLLFLSVSVGLLYTGLYASGKKKMEEKPHASPLAGVWQRSHSAAIIVWDSLHRVEIGVETRRHMLTAAFNMRMIDTATLSFTPDLKWLSKGGAYQNLYMASDTVLIYERGRYEVLSPGRYAEYLEHSHTTYPPKEKVLLYRLLSDKYLLLACEHHRPRKWAELWERVAPDGAAPSEWKRHAVTEAPCENGAVYMVEKYVPKHPNEQIRYSAVQRLPQFPGGTGELEKFISANLRYPEASRRRQVKGRVWVRFVVNSKGYVERPEVMEGLDEHCNEEALRIVKSMPRWLPGEGENRSPVASFYSVPFDFR